jgi:hypothetical protein
MSTMLKSAAMSLLSKTLQAFLSKYLSDVDVEGVALPSMYDGSGWGVRLSNVKLRDGVQLMECMPGKRIQRRRTTATTKKKKRNTKTKRTRTIRSRSTVVGETTTGRATAKSKEEDLPQSNMRRWSRTPGPDDRGSRNETRRGSAGVQVSSSRSRVNSYDELEVSVRSPDEKGEDPSSSRPVTPDQDSKSIFSCFTKGRKAEKRASTGEMDTTSSNTDDDEESLLTHPPVSIVEEQPMFRRYSSLAMDEQRGSGYMGDYVKSVKLDDNDDQDEEESDSEDEFEDYEQPYRLCVGDSGRIGTLDIRYVSNGFDVSMLACMTKS